MILMEPASRADAGGAAAGAQSRVSPRIASRLTRSGERRSSGRLRRSCVMRRRRPFVGMGGRFSRIGLFLAMLGRAGA